MAVPIVVLKEAMRKSGFGAPSMLASSTQLDLAAMLGFALPSLVLVESTDLQLRPAINISPGSTDSCSRFAHSTPPSPLSRPV
ncbi:hypothetical protein GOBAR_AA08100 [Gossypium barbadense]|uniref:Uncharacterized protein n=1 Tax=Gossypium barbadense TaxID=3634 RepID=A0A2P5YAH1_GOSBA|nr:hypothetical protein GOBAR_AA08100 [Gossypium barbadense]